jgi:phosphate starvation-inducible PhoH-like protein
LLKLAEEQPVRRQRRADKIVKPLTKAQALYDQAITSNIITFSTGPAGAGKTWWAAMRAAKALDAGEIERIIITRPAVEAGEEMGFLPGELDEKYEPYFRPVRDALEEFLGSGPLEYHLKAKTIEARPLAYLRGATLKNAFVILDEAQNTTPTQMKLFLTRIGEETKVVVDGDLTQKDINGVSGLEDALARLRNVPGVGFVTFSREDIVRSGICRDICAAYDA